MVTGREALAKFFRINNLKYGKCLEPHMECDQKAIRAHSIQNSSAFELLSENNHVITLRPRFSQSGPEIEYKSVGRNEASTFTGLCNQHDTKIFVKIDNEPLNIADREQLFLIAYRSVTFELHAVMEAATKIQSAYSSRVDMGIDSADEPSPAGIIATEQLMLSHATWRYREKHFDQAILDCCYAGIEHDVIEMENQRPCLAVSSFFTFEDRTVSAYLSGITLNVFPVSENKTIAILSYAREDSGAARVFLDRVLTSNEEYQKYELSKLILSRTSNFFISPRHYQSWSHEKTQRIKNEFIMTVCAQQEIDEHQDLMLF